MIAADSKLVLIQVKSFEERKAELQEQVTREYMKLCKVMKEEELYEIMRDKGEGSNIENKEEKGMNRMETKRQKQAEDYRS